MVFGIELGGIRVIPVSRDVAAQPEVFDITGQRVGAFEKNNVIEGGGWSWDGGNIDGYGVAPGIYLVRAAMASGEVVILRLGVIQ